MNYLLDSSLQSILIEKDLDYKKIHQQFKKNVQLRLSIEFYKQSNQIMSTRRQRTQLSPAIQSNIYPKSPQLTVTRTPTTKLFNSNNQNYEMKYLESLTSRLRLKASINGKEKMGAKTERKRKSKGDSMQKKLSQNGEGKIQQQQLKYSLDFYPSLQYFKKRFSKQ